MRKVAMTLPYSPSKFDNWRLAEVGGWIGFDRKGTPVFRFASLEQYNKYLELNKERVSS